MEKSESRRQSGPGVSRSDLEFRSLLEQLPFAAYTCDARGHLTYFNRQAAELWGREPRLNHPVDRFCGSFRLYATDGAPLAHEECGTARALAADRPCVGEEIVIERHDGSRRTVLAHANPLHADSGEISGAVSVLVDITERKRAECLLEEADRRKNQFLATLAHELRNPLAPIRNGLLILRRENDEAMVEQIHSMMERQLEHMVRLVDDLLDLSRITTAKVELRKERIELAGAVQDAVDSSRPLIEAAGHTLTVSLPQKPVIVSGDRTRLAQVFANLLNNSAKYTERGGHIGITVERQGSDAVIRVKDNGVGIPAHMLPKVFDMFTQVDRSLDRAQGGLGIGLSLVRGLVEKHGGSVRAMSGGNGKGSEFLVRLPLAASTDAARREDHERRLPRSSRYRILVVDDNRDAAISLGLILQIAGHETRTAYDGIEAVQAAEAFLPDVVLLDIGLPGRNGYEACRSIRAEAWGGRMVIIALTGWDQEDDKRQSMEAGFNFHMVKPVDPSALKELLAGLLLTPA
jgi:signal transduction histidine kinase